MSWLFADAFYFVARLNRHDQHHEKAIKFVLSANVRLVTSEWVLVEMAVALAKSEVRPSIREIIQEMRQSSLFEVVAASHSLFEGVLDFYHRHQDKQWSLTDCTSFFIMQERGITEALTGDRHFEQAGYVALLK